MVVDASWDWPCPYCRQLLPLNAEQCTNCGAQLRDVSNELFVDLEGSGPGGVVEPSVEPVVEPPVVPVVEAVAPGVGFVPPPLVQVTDPVDDPNGLAAAVSRVHPDDAEAAATPICVAAALLRDGEVVRAVVTGQMLGCAAVVVLTDRRLLVVNGRRWQPIVDSFAIGPDLVVRGRHDRHVALLTFSEGSRLSTVDGIGDVGLAVELAERLRLG